MDVAVFVVFVFFVCWRTMSRCVSCVWLSVGSKFCCQLFGWNESESIPSVSQSYVIFIFGVAFRIRICWIVVF